VISVRRERSWRHLRKILGEDGDEGIVKNQEGLCREVNHAGLKHRSAWREPFTRRLVPTSKSELRSSRPRKVGARLLSVRFARPRKPDKFRATSHGHYHRLRCLPGKSGMAWSSPRRHVKQLLWFLWFKSTRPHSAWPFSAACLGAYL